MELNVEKIEAAVVTEVADRIIGEERLYERVNREVNVRLDKHFREVADKQIAEIVDKAIRDGLEHEYRRVDTFGQQTGEPTTIRKELERMIAGYWNEKVDKNGKPSSYGGVSRAEHLMTQLCAKDFSNSINEDLIRTAAAVKDGLRAELRKSVDEMLAGLFHVRTETDKEEGRRK